MATQSSEVQSVPTVHYIIAVHGIGEQRKNETVFPVISQFAAARHAQADQVNVMTLGLLAAECTDADWIELDEIPRVPDSSLHGTQWYPRGAPDPHGENLRFFDCVWSNVMREQFPHVGQSVKDWSTALLNRLKVREQSGTTVLDWIIQLLATLQDGVLKVQFVLNLRDKSVSKKIFEDFLGDVELYGDFPNTRGRAVRLFHETMAKLHQDHLGRFGSKVKPQYTIIAHSLGTVMTLDAITYAHANEDSRKSSDVSDNPHILHFPGYNLKKFAHEESLPESCESCEPGEIPSTEWVRYLASFVTLGSPIDKYLALWTENYLHLDHTDWVDPKILQSRSEKIRHFNYSDEQDPVGHELDILETTPVHKDLFEISEDIVFTRYPIPGVAHVEYWNDYDLFRRILDVAIDKRSVPLEAGKKPSGHYTEWFKPQAYVKALFLCYVVVPVIGWFIATYFFAPLLDWTFKVITPASNQAFDPGAFPWLALGGFGLTVVLTHIVMQLIITWRLLLVNLRSDETPLIEKTKRKHVDKAFNALIYGTPVLWTLLLLSALTPGVHEWLVSTGLLKTWLVSIGLAFLVSFDIALIYTRTHRRLDNLKKIAFKAKTFREYIGNGVSHRP
ncbi:MAG: hypothetical protein ACU843_03250 [Gammaproteobacteria bacterium]